MKRVTIVLVLAAVLGAGAAAQQTPSAPAAPAPQPPCGAPEARQMDFWLGDWDLTWPNPEKPGETLRGANHVTRELDACVIEENFSGLAAIPLRGRSFSVYSPRLGRWQQTWVDNTGGYIDLVGSLRDGQLVLEREITLAGGSRVRQRMIFRNIKPDSFDWSWERSTDGGQNWQVVWPIHYQRRK